MLKWITVCLLCCVASTAHATTRYLAKAAQGGSNSNSCAASTSVSTPKLTFTGSSGALSCMSAGDILFVRAGTYNEYLHSRVTNGRIASGTSWVNYTRVAAYNGEVVWMQPTTADPYQGSVMCFGCVDGDTDEYIEVDGINMDMSQALPINNYNVAIFGCNYNGSQGARHIRLQNLTQIGAPGYQGSPTTGVTANGVFTNCPNFVGDTQFINVTIHGGGEGGANGHGWYISGDNVLIDHCTVYDVTGWGMQLYDGGGILAITGVVVRNSTFHDIIRRDGSTRPPAGIIVDLMARDAQIYNNVFYNIGNPDFTPSAAIAVNSGASGTLIYNNTIYNMTDGTSGVWILSGAGTGTAIRNNIAYAVTGTEYIDDTHLISMSNNLSNGTNPQFANASAANFHLTSLSTAAIGTGADLNSVFTYDHDLVVRGAVFDIGAYEFVDSCSVPGTPTSFSPADTATGVSVTPTLSWSASGATSYRVYFGSYIATGLATISDTFNRSDNTDLGATWTPNYGGTANGQIISNAVRTTSTSIDSVETNTTAVQDDQWGKITIGAITSNDRMIDVALRFADSPTYSGYIAGPAFFTGFGFTSWLMRIDSGTATYLATENATTWVAGDVVLFQAVGTVLTLYRCTPTCTSLLSYDTVSDTTKYTTGKVGFDLYSATLGNETINTFEGGTYGPEFIGTQAGATYSPSTLANSTVYYWQIVAVNSCGSTAGSVLSFTTEAGASPPVSGTGVADPRLRK